ncbi:hypothetical protein Taro_041667 [Colocasia esculenta]|uniref:Uncharacterized protein n=1 Tax=Colocasia esculenta TaxID=4460 RepID=A0A843WWH5_COLES|nr:hypothetical protein [Colocasia esculenta]
MSRSCFVAAAWVDAFKRFKHGDCRRRDSECNVKSFVLARQSRGCFVRRRGGAVVASPVISGGFRLRMARAAREPREDNARSMGVLSARRLWGDLRRLLLVVADFGVVTQE